MPESPGCDFVDFMGQFIAGRMVCLICVNTEWIVAALDAEIARLQLARTLIAQSTTVAFGTPSPMI
jgi:hypothetical protein